MKKRPGRGFSRPLAPVLFWAWAVWAGPVVGLLAAAPAGGDPWTLDARYAPPWRQTAIGLPDDWQKTLVGKEGSLLYDWPGGYSGFATRLTPGLAEETEWVRQELVSPRVPIVRTIKRTGKVELVEEAFALAPPLPARKDSGAAASVDCGGDEAALNRPPRHDIVLVHVRNLDDREIRVVPRLTIDSELTIRNDPERQRVLIGPATALFFSHSVEYTKESDGQLVLSFMPLSVAARGEKAFAYGVARGRKAEPFALDVVRAEAQRRRAELYWQNLDLP